MWGQKRVPALALLAIVKPDLAIFQRFRKLTLGHDWADNDSKFLRRRRVACCPESELETPPDAPSTRKAELRSFLFLTVVMAPILTVMIVGGYGFLVWMYQMVNGPPTY